MPILKLTSWFNAFPIKIEAMFFVTIDKLILKCIWKVTGSRTGKTILTQKKGAFAIPNIKTYGKATVMNTVWYLKDRHIDLWNRR